MHIGDETWVDNEIHREHSLIGHRMNWFVGSQSFLLTAYAVANDGTNHLEKLFRILFPPLGVSMSVITWAALLAAIVSMNDLIVHQQEFCSDHKDDPRYKFFAHWTCRRPTLSRLGMLPPILVPLFFLAVWIILWAKA